ncbi:MAG: T9SS type A sorting domain-containing protein [Lentimicrobiaceae bacterium]|nr:T9SS type A sorting domain-containing protein [Lentimicrobiaceae bacterium]
MKKIISIFSIIAFFIAPFFTQAQTTTSATDTASYPYWVEMMQDPNANFYQTVRAFNIYWEGREITRGCGYKPFRRWENLMRTRVNSEGKIPANNRELEAYKRMKEITANRKTITTAWEQLGPFNVPSGYNGYRGLGRLNAIDFHPTNENIIYVGAPSGGLWATYNGGQSWQVLTDHLPTLGVSSIIVNKNNPNVILIGTGDVDAGDAPGLGIWRSTDGGTTWEESNNGLGYYTVGRMVVDPNNANFILVATSGGIYRSTDGGYNWTSSKNGNFKDIVFKPGNTQIIYATGNGQFWRSEDSGVTFTRITSGIQSGSRGVIGVSPADPNVVYFLLCNQADFQGIYRSTDSGLNFECRSNSPNIMGWDCYGGSGGQAWYDLDVAVDPTNANIIFGGGVNNFKSTDGGTTWQICSHWWGDCGVTSVHADLHIMEYSPVNGKLYAGNDGGIYWSDDQGNSWTEISNGLVISQAYKIGQSATNVNLVINGYQDNGTSTFVGDDWINVGGGDGMECWVDPTDDSYSYSTIYYGAIDRHKNNQYQGAIAGEGTNGITESGNWVTPFLIDYWDGNIMFIGYRNIWRSKNIKAGSTSQVRWEKISDFSGSNMDILVQCRSNGDIIYAGAGNRLYRTENSKDSEVSWQNISSQLPITNTITAIETDHLDDKIIYLAQQTQIFKSTDRGNSWEEITLNLSNLQINSIALYKNGDESLYIGTDAGVYYKDNSMNEWVIYDNGMPASARVTEIEIFYDPTSPSGDLLRAGTYGRGLWSAPPIPSALLADFEVSSTTTSENCPIQFKDLSFGVPYEWLWTFEGGTPATSTEKNPTVTYANQGTYSVTLTVTNSLGSNTETKADYIIVDAATAPTASFSATPTAGCVGLIVQFIDESTNCPASWNWTIEPNSITYLEGTNSNSQNPVVRFNESLNYDITLSVTNNSGSNSILKDNFISTTGHQTPYMPQIYEDMFNVDWEIINPDNNRTWEVKEVMGEPTLWMHLYNYAAPRTRDYAISPAFNLIGAPEASLKFKYAYAQRATITDSLIVSISDDCGETWTRIYANGPDGSGIFETSEPVSMEFEPTTEADWCGVGYGASCPSISLSPWLNKSNLRLQFETYNSYGNNLYIKDIEIDHTVGIAEISSQNSFYMTPNPAKESLNIVLKNSEKGELKITDMNGKLLIKQFVSGENNKINVSELVSGIYIVSVETTHQVSHQKVIIE